MAATAHTGVIPGAEAEKLYAYPALPTDAAKTSKVLRGDGTWVNTADITVGAASNLTMTSHIDGIEFNGANDITHFVVCMTKGDVAKKEITVSAGFNSDGGAFLFMWLYYTNTAENPTLSVNGSEELPFKDAYGHAFTPGSRMSNGMYMIMRSNAYEHWIIMRGPYHFEPGATATSNGIMTAEDKVKLDSLAEHPTITAATGVPTGNQSPGFGGTFTVNQVSRDSLGHVSAITSRTITIPSSAASTTAAGLMSKDDKIKLNGIATEANKYVHPTLAAKTGVTVNATPAFGDVVTISAYTTNGTGHVSAMTNRKLTIPNSAVTSSASGLMTSAMLASLQTAAADIAALKAAISGGCTATVNASGNLVFDLGTYKTGFLTIEKAGEY